VGLACWALGNFLLVYLTIVSSRVVRRGDLLVAALTVPVYWVMMAIAAVKATLQLVLTPTFWEKTVHGLHLAHEEGGVAPAGARPAGAPQPHPVRPA
jgi:hypothetical protein